MILDPRALIMFGANALLLYLAQLVNSATAVWPIYLFLMGPMIVLPALYLYTANRFMGGCMFADSIRLFHDFISHNGSGDLRDSDAFSSRT